MKPSIQQSVVVEQLQTEVNKFIGRTVSPEIGAARTQCASRIEMDSNEPYIKVTVVMEFMADDNTLTEMLKYKAEPVDMNRVEEGV